MIKHKPIAMRCTQAQFDEIKHILEAENKIIEHIQNFTGFPYLVSNFLNSNTITNNSHYSMNSYNREVFEQWDASKFLEYCNINPLKYLIPMTKQVTLSEELAKQMIASGIEELKALALENYPNLQKSKYPMKREELGGKIIGYYISSHNEISRTCHYKNEHQSHNLYPTEELAKAAQVLPLLLQLRNAWWKADGWDIETAETWFGISNYKEGIRIISDLSYFNPPFSFKDYKTAQLFLDTFRVELEIAKPLL